MPPRSFRPSAGVAAVRGSGTGDDLLRPSDSELLSALDPPERGATDDAPAMTPRVVCEHADRCGGCPLIALPYGEQLAMKRGRVVQSASRYPTLELVYTEPVAAADPIAGYRTRAKLIASSGGRLGLYAKGGGHQVVDIPRCRVLSPALTSIASMLRARIVADEKTGGPLAPFAPGGGGALRAVDLRELGGDDGARILLTLVVERARVAGREVFEETARSLAAEAPSIIGVALNLHDGESTQVLGNDTVIVHGVSSAPDRVGRSHHEATYGSFVQAHRGQAERVQETLVDLLGLDRARARGEDGPRPRVLDLYGGSGAIALSLARAGAEVHLVEWFAQAAAHAGEAARAQGLPVRAEAADVSVSLRRLAEDRTPFLAAVVNPPRRGMSPLARELIARLDVATLAYVSCDPDSLARDLDHLSRLGFTVSTLRPLDMVPLTEEVETIALLRRVGAPMPKVAYEDEEVLIVEKGPHEPTAPHFEYASSLLHRARRLPGAQDAVPVHSIDVGTSGLVMLVKNPERAAAWEALLGAATSRKIFIAGVRGVTPSKGVMTRELRDEGKMYPARTRYRRLAVASGHSVLRVIPEQGRTHQILRHLATIGHPVLGDDRYGHAPTNRFFEEKLRLDRTFLHCVRLEFDHPASNQRMIVEAAMPGDLRAVLERAGGPDTLRFLEHKNALGHAGLSSFPPPPDSGGSALALDSSSPSVHPERVDDLDDSREGGGF